MVRDPVVREALVGLAEAIHKLSATVALMDTRVAGGLEETLRRYEGCHENLREVTLQAEAIKARVMDRG